MLAGAREFLVKPFSSDELTASIRQLYSREKEKAGRVVAAVVPHSAEPPELGTVVAVFSPKGGVGRTTIAVNLAVVAATELDKKVVLVDGSFQFGDVAVPTEPEPQRQVDVRARVGPRGGRRHRRPWTPNTVTHSSGVHVILAPPSPEMADVITPTGVKRVVEALRQRYEHRGHRLRRRGFNDTTLGIDP